MFSFRSLIVNRRCWQYKRLIASARCTFGLEGIHEGQYGSRSLWIWGSVVPMSRPPDRSHGSRNGIPPTAPLAPSSFSSNGAQFNRSFNLTVNMQYAVFFLLVTTTAVLSNPVMTRVELQNLAQKEEFCSNFIHFNNFYYSMGESKSINGFPADMSIHWKTDNVYYTLINDEMKMSLQLFRSTGEMETIKIVGLGQSTTVDNLNDIVYLATDNGVYKYKEDGATELYSALGEDVMYITVSSDGTTMYIATWPQNRVHKITNEGQKQETFSAIPNGHGLTVDPRNNIFFIATKTSYVLKNSQRIPIKIKGLPSERMTGVFVSRSDEIFAMDENSNLFAVDTDNASASRLGDFNVTGVNTFAMDSADNVLIGVKGSIMKFNAHEQNPCSNYEKNNKIGKRNSRRRHHTTSTTEVNEDYEE